MIVCIFQTTVTFAPKILLTMGRQLLLLGGNQGNVTERIQEAITCLSTLLGEPVQSSAYYESEPWGFEAEQNFINQVVEFESAHLPEELLKITQQIEKDLGRKQKTGTHYESRPIDIDILFMDNLVVDLPHLTIPHPRLHDRRFTLLPLMDHWAELVHPTLNYSVEELLSQCKDEGSVKKLS